MLVEHFVGVTVFCDNSMDDNPEEFVNKLLLEFLGKFLHRVLDEYLELYLLMPLEAFLVKEIWNENLQEIPQKFVEHRLDYNIVKKMNKVLVHFLKFLDKDKLRIEFS